MMADLRWHARNFVAVFIMMLPGWSPPWWRSFYKVDVVRLYHAGSLTIARRVTLEKVKPWR